MRLDLLPYLEQNFNSSIRQNLLQTAEILNAEEELLAELTEESCQQLVEVSENQVPTLNLVLNRSGSKPGLSSTAIRPCNEGFWKRSAG